MASGGGGGELEEVAVGVEDDALVVAVAGGAGAVYEGEAVLCKAAGEGVDAIPVADAYGDVGVAYARARGRGDGARVRGRRAVGGDL